MMTTMMTIMTMGISRKLQNNIKSIIRLNNLIIIVLKA